jgi:hypothetical protein
MSELVVSLREIAVRLGKLQRQPRRLDTDRLLSLLQSGNLKAGFHYPAEPPVWIAIALQHWLGVSSPDLRSLGSSDDDGRPGTYEVRIGAFASEFVESLRPRLTSGTPTGWKEFEDALRTASRQYEVVVMEREWHAYLKLNNLEYPPSEHRTLSGRPEKGSWRKLSVIIGAYLLKDMESTNKDLKIEAAAKIIHNRANEDGIQNLPSVATIRDCLSEIRKMAPDFSMK